MCQAEGSVAWECVKEPGHRKKQGQGARVTRAGEGAPRKGQSLVVAGEKAGGGES